MPSKPEGMVRLSMEAKYHLRQELHHIARKNCDEHLRAFAECAKANGLGVVLFCRSQNNASKFSNFERTWLKRGHVLTRSRTYA